MIQKKYKICMVSDSLATGGAERVAANLSIFFDAQNHDIHHVIVQKDIKYAFAGKLLNLGKFKNLSNNYQNKIKRFLILKKFIDNNNFDFIVDFRVKNSFWQELLISKIIYKPTTIYCVHSFMLDLYFPSNKWLAKKIFEHKNIIAISNDIKTEIEKKYQFKNIEVLYNSIDISEIQKQAQIDFDRTYEYIVAAGTLNNVKQFANIIECYSKTKLPQKGIKLVILGDGENKNDLEQLVKKLNIGQYVIFEGRVENPFRYFANALFLIQASLFEGLPMVLIEALACQTPVVAFDCKSGPSEIINDQINGLLVENQNFEKLTLSIDLMISDQNLYQKCRKNTLSSIIKFDSKIIGNQWINYFNKIKQYANSYH